MKLILCLNGAKKTYTGTITARASLRAFELLEDIERSYIDSVAALAALEAPDGNDADNADFESMEFPVSEEKTQDAEPVYGPKQIDAMLEFVVELFGGQFTRDEFLDGFRDSLFAGVPPMLRAVVSGIQTKILTFPNAEASPGEESKKKKA